MNLPSISEPGASPIDARGTRTAAPREMSVEQLLHLGTSQVERILTLVANSLPTLRRPAMGRTRERQDDLHCKRPHD
jgi:hypothetical protein